MQCAVISVVRQDEEIDWGKCQLSVPELVQKVKEYNAQINGNLPIVLVRETHSLIQTLIML